MNNQINIAFASDDNYAQHIAVVIASIMENTQDAICFYIINDNISTEKIEKLKNTALNLKAKIEFIDVPQEKFNDLYLSGHVSKAAYLRLALADILPNEINKIIYLDVDLLVYDDIKKLWDIDLQNLSLAAVPDFGIMTSKRLCRQKKQVLGLPVGKSYFNSGVLVINLKEWRKRNYTKQILEMIHNNSFPHHDQDALNKLFMNKWKSLDLRWNIIPPVFNLFPKVLLNRKFRSNAIQAKKNPGIIHYAGRYKPWEFAQHVGFNDIYYKYLRQTAFAEISMPQPGKDMRGKSIVRQLIRLKIANFWTKIL